MLTKEQASDIQSRLDALQSFLGSRRSYLAAEVAHLNPPTNDERSALEVYRLTTEPPETFVAYIGKTIGDGMGVDRHGPTSRRALTTWTGEQLGYCALRNSWRVGSAYGSRMYQVHATAFGREYTGRGFGEGMSIVLRETASSKRKRATSNTP